ncbi:tetratricopeptide repeat protein [Marinobacteraceae bacterium S3BR75-40.1]
MKVKRVLTIALLTSLLTIGLAGCSGENGDMSQDQVQFLSHLDQARFFQNQGELKASILEARSAIKLKPRSVEPYLIIAENLLTAGDASNAEKQLQEILDHEGSTQADQITLNNLYIALSRAQFMQGKQEEALKTLEKVSEPDRSQVLESLILRGDIQLAQRNTDAARDAYQQALDKDSDAVQAIVGLSKAAYLNGNEDQARKMVEDAAASHPDSTELALWRAQMAHREGRLDVAREAYGKALEEIGKYDIMTYRKYQTMSALIDVLRQQGNAAQAMVYEEILAKSAPGTIKSNMESASKAYNKGDLDKAAQHLEEVLKQSPRHSQAKLMLGLVRFQQGRAKDAEALLSDVVNLSGDVDMDDDANKLLAAAKIQLRQPGEARKILEKLDPDQKDPGVLALVGIASLASGDTENGEEYIERSLEMEPDNIKLRMRYATHLFRTGSQEKGIEQARKAVEQAPENDNAHLLLVSMLTQTQDYKAARTALSEWRKSHPESAMASISAGNIEMAQGNLNEARNEYQKALKQAPNNAEPHLALFRLEAKAGQDNKAFEQIKQAITKSPNSRGALQSLVAFTGSDPDRRKAAMEFLTEVSDSNSDALGPRLVLFEYQLRQGQFDQAKAIADKVQSIAGDEEQAARMLAPVYANTFRSLRGAKKTDQASQVLRQGRLRFPENLQLSLLEAGLLFSRDNEDEALSLLRDVKLQHADAPQPYMLEADYRMGKGQYSQAVELYQMARDKSDSPEATLKLSNALQKSGQEKKAIELLESAGKNFDSSPQVHLALAMAYQQNSEPKKAIPVYERLLELTPRNVVALNNLAWIYQEQDDPKAMDLAQKAYELSPKSAAVADTYGWILYQAGKVEDSVPVLENAHKLAPQAKEIALHLAEAYKANGQNDKAKEVLQKI